MQMDVGDMSFFSDKSFVDSSCSVINNSGRLVAQDLSRMVLFYGLYIWWEAKNFREDIEK